MNSIKGSENFEIIEMIGQGAIGKVYKVIEKETQNIYAMKTIKKNFITKEKKINRCLNEQDILLQLDHPFIINMYYSFQSETHIYFILDYCCGGNLYNLLKKMGTFSEDYIKFYSSEILLGLEYLHFKDCIYRDLKPENILIRDSGHIAITDFDLATFDPEHKNIFEFTLWNKIKNKFMINNKINFSKEPNILRYSFVGTIEYIAPEIILQQHYTACIDWWSFGILLYEMAYGKTPFVNNNISKITYSILHQKPTLKNISKNLKSLIKKLLKRNPKKRLGFQKGSCEIKNHMFYENISWEFIRNITPPYIPLQNSNENKLNNKKISTDLKNSFRKRIISEPQQNEKNRHRFYSDPTNEFSNFGVLQKVEHHY
jgi:protein-serine/threonine kinase